MYRGIRIQDALGAPARLCHRNSESRTPVAKRISGGATLAEIAHRLGRKALEEVAGAAQPDTILGWYRKLIARKFDGSRFRQRMGRPRIAEEIERLVVRIANENLPGPGLAGATGSKPDHGAVGMPERLPLSTA